MPELPEVDSIIFLPRAGGLQPSAPEERNYGARTLKIERRIF